MEQYIGSKKVGGVVELPEKTPAKADMVEVLFDDGKKEKMPKSRFELLVTPEVSDETQVQVKLQARVGAVLFGMLHEYGVKWGEINQMSDAMIALCNNGMQKASDIIWGYEKAEIPLNEINKVLIDNHVKHKESESNNGAGSEGGGSN